MSCYVKFNKIPRNRIKNNNRHTEDPHLKQLPVSSTNVNKEPLDIKEYFDKYHHRVRKFISDKSDIKDLAALTVLLEDYFSDCPICYDCVPKIDQVTTSECKHLFCENCTFSLCKNENCFSCPLCRSNVTEIIRKDRKHNKIKDIITVLEPVAPKHSFNFFNGLNNIRIFRLGPYMIILYRDSLSAPTAPATASTTNEMATSPRTLLSLLNDLSRLNTTTEANSTEVANDVENDVVNSVEHIEVEEDITTAVEDDQEESADY